MIEEVSAYIGPQILMTILKDVFRYVPGIFDKAFEHTDYMADLVLDEFEDSNDGLLVEPNDAYIRDLTSKFEEQGIPFKAYLTSALSDDVSHGLGSFCILARVIDRDRVQAIKDEINKEWQAKLEKEGKTLELTPKREDKEQISYNSEDEPQEDVNKDDDTTNETTITNNDTDSPIIEEDDSEKRGKKKKNKDNSSKKATDDNSKEERRRLEEEQRKLEEQKRNDKKNREDQEKISKGYEKDGISSPSESAKNNEFSKEDSYIKTQGADDLRDDVVKPTDNDDLQNYDYEKNAESVTTANDSAINNGNDSYPSQDDKQNIATGIDKSLDYPAGSYSDAGNSDNNPFTPNPNIDNVDSNDNYNSYNDSEKPIEETRHEAVKGNTAIGSDNISVNFTNGGAAFDNNEANNTQNNLDNETSSLSGKALNNDDTKDNQDNTVNKVSTNNQPSNSETTTEKQNNGISEGYNGFNNNDSTNVDNVVSADKQDAVSNNPNPAVASTNSSNFNNNNNSNSDSNDTKANINDSKPSVFVKTETNPQNDSDDKRLESSVSESHTKKGEDNSSLPTTSTLKTTNVNNVLTGGIANTIQDVNKLLDEYKETTATFTTVTLKNISDEIAKNGGNLIDLTDRISLKDSKTTKVLDSTTKFAKGGMYSVARLVKNRLIYNTLIDNHTDTGSAFHSIRGNLNPVTMALTSEVCHAVKYEKRIFHACGSVGEKMTELLGKDFIKSKLTGKDFSKCIKEFGFSKDIALALKDVGPCMSKKELKNVLKTFGNRLSSEQIQFLKLSHNLGKANPYANVLLSPEALITKDFIGILGNKITGDENFQKGFRFVKTYLETSKSVVKNGYKLLNKVIDKVKIPIKINGKVTKQSIKHISKAAISKTKLGGWAAKINAKASKKMAKMASKRATKGGFSVIRKGVKAVAHGMSQLLKMSGATSATTTVASSAATGSIAAGATGAAGGAVGTGTTTFALVSNPIGWAVIVVIIFVMLFLIMDSNQHVSSTADDSGMSAYVFAQEDTEFLQDIVDTLQDYNNKFNQQIANAKYGRGLTSNVIGHQADNNATNYESYTVIFRDYYGNELDPKTVDLNNTKDIITMATRYFGTPMLKVATEASAEEKETYDFKKQHFKDYCILLWAATHQISYEEYHPGNTTYAEYDTSGLTTTSTGQCSKNGTTVWRDDDFNRNNNMVTKKGIQQDVYCVHCTNITDGLDVEENLCTQPKTGNEHGGWKKTGKTRWVFNCNAYLENNGEHAMTYRGDGDDNPPEYGPCPDHWQLTGETVFKEAQGPTECPVKSLFGTRRGAVRQNCIHQEFEWVYECEGHMGTVCYVTIGNLSRLPSFGAAGDVDYDAVGKYNEGATYSNATPSTENTEETSEDNED